jgi:SAM-dependent methyltransferase
MYTSFGYFEQRDDDLKVLRNVLRSLTAGGRLVIEVLGKEVLARIFLPTTCTEAPDGTRIFEQHEILSDWKRIRNRWLVVRGDRARTFELEHTIYSGRELEELMVEAGFEGVRLFGNLAGDPYDRHAARLVAMGEKPATIR